MGERLQWCVEGGDYKASYLLPEDDSSGLMDEVGNEKQLQSGGLLISETAVPGFEAADHEFLTHETMEKLLTPEQVKELQWLLRNHEVS
ncbi:uncharacterized protein APUU_12042A [Aspergillus puulaauensis]|uniref:DUF985 domain-containing protein n=1 Tax=Aspergillus puulaauensis TaxID=1220207 RepID=A0A7R7XEH1_9EURO|nr:uncharacterized protein APUU_12042A [Aspergillus puulaauensis]BCS19214.1 hypothetical protein APUU_12042A [Aspergillus puulaauensis]